jgi:hypothetical protein
MRLVVSNKNNRIGLLVIAVTIISLSSLPLNEWDTLTLLSFSAEPVFAQLSGQAIPYGEEQVPTISSSSSSSSAMDLRLFMDSFANSIFNGTSTFGVVGTSIVEGIEITGISLDKSQNRLSVIVTEIATELQGGSNSITSTNTTTSTTSTTPNSNSVSIIAMRIPINVADILSLAAASSSSNDNVLGSTMENTSEDPSSAFPPSSFNPFSLLSSLQIGSGALIDVDWSQPQTVTMDLVGSGVVVDQEQQQLDSDDVATGDFVLVSVIPYTGLANNTVSSIR